MAEPATAAPSRSGLLDQLRARIEPPGPRLMLPEGDDPRVLEAALRISAARLGRPIILGEQAALEREAERLDLAAAGVTVVTNSEAMTPGLLAEFAREQRVSPLAASSMLERPELLGAAFVRAGEADALLVGARTTTHDVAKACHRVFGLVEGRRHASGFFLVETSDARPVLMADCALQPDPDADDLAEIAVQTARSARNLFGWEPRVAMLSFSTHHSARHPSVEKVRAATALARRVEPGLAIDGELQADVAVDPEAAAHKLEVLGPVAGQANVLIFPELESSNIAYKLLRTLGHAQAVGVILQGYRWPASDVSRGARVGELVDTATVLAALASGATGMPSRPRPGPSGQDRLRDLGSASSL